MSEAGTASLVAKPVAAPPAGTPAPSPAPEPQKPAGTGLEVKADATLAGGAEPSAAPAAVVDGKAPDAADKATAVEAAWPDDWREQMAGGNDKLLKQLKRYASPNTVASAFVNLRTRLDSGEFKKGLAPDATDDEIAQWRKDNGVPEKPEGYAMPEGLAIGEEDKPIIESYLKDAHGRNLSPSEVQANVKWFYAAQDQMRQQMAEADLAHKAESEDALRTEWGNEFRANINSIKGYLQQTAPSTDFMDRLLGGRLADGSLIGNNADVLKWLDARRREENPYPTVVGAGQASPLASIETEIKALEARMSSKDESVRKSWFNDEPANARYRELIGLREKVKAKAA